MNKTNLDAFKMSKAQMNNVNGGVSREEWCEILKELIMNNPIADDEEQSELFQKELTENGCLE